MGVGSTRIVCARSCAEMPVPIPVVASTDTVKDVPLFSAANTGWSGTRSWSSRAVGIAA